MRLSALSCSLLLLASSALAQSTTEPVRYTLAFPNAVHHEARITVEFPSPPGTEPLHVRMARSSPGRYALHEFVKNVYDVQAADAAGRPLPITRPDPYGWDVARPATPGPVRFTYTLYADRTDGTYAGIDAEHAHLNLPATLVWARGLESLPCRVRFEMPAGSSWDVATQLRPEADGSWSAPHLQYLMDSPTALARHKRRSWQQGGQKFELAVAHRGTDAEVDSLAARTQRITRVAEAIWGELPRFDFNQYTFIANYLPTAAGDGMEHRNSTSVTLPKPLSGGDTDHLGTISHELFHAWNVERLRPADLEPFDLERANMSDLLWLAEGFTMYYGDLMMRRAHLINDAAYLKELSILVNQKQQPGATRFSPIEMSRQAPFVDAARSVDPNNRINTYVSYYTIGAGTALALDLELRARNHSLDELMRRLWQRYGQTQTNYAPTNPYKVTDVQQALTEVAGDSAFAGQFFRRHVYGHQPHAWNVLLAPAGLTVKPANPQRAWLGALGYEFSTQGATIATGTIVSSPLYQAGLDRGDVLLRVNGRRLRTQQELDKILNSLEPGKAVEAEVQLRTEARPRKLQLTPVSDPTLRVASLTEHRGMKRPKSEPSVTHQPFLEAWWGK